MFAVPMALLVLGKKPRIQISQDVLSAYELFRGDKFSDQTDRKYLIRCAMQIIIIIKMEHSDYLHILDLDRDDKNLLLFLRPYIVVLILILYMSAGGLLQDC
jgi:hypothetical protein